MLLTIDQQIKQYFFPKTNSQERIKILCNHSKISDVMMWQESVFQKKRGREGRRKREKEQERRKGGGREGRRESE